MNDAVATAASGAVLLRLIDAIVALRPVRPILKWLFRRGDLHWTRIQRSFGVPKVAKHKQEETLKEMQRRSAGAGRAYNYGNQARHPQAADISSGEVPLSGAVCSVAQEAETIPYLSSAVAAFMFRRVWRGVAGFAPPLVAVYTVTVLQTRGTTRDEGWGR